MALLVQCNRRDIGRIKGTQFACIRNTILIGINPDFETIPGGIFIV
jgi:hypothetical protein